MAQGFEDLGAVSVPSTTSFQGFVDLGGIPVEVVPTEFQKPPETSATGVFPSLGLSESIKQAIPFYGATTAFKTGFKTGEDVLGENILGSILGTAFGGAMGLGTVANPLAKGLSEIPVLVQAGSEAAGGQPSLAGQTLLGQRTILPDLSPSAYDTGSQNLNTALNLGSEFLTQARKDPVNAGMIFQGLTSPKATTSAIASEVSKFPLAETLNTFGSATYDVAAGTTKSIAKTFVPKSTETSWLDALNPKGNAINPQKTVAAVQNAKKSLESILPDIKPLELESGIVPNTAQGMSDLSIYARKNIWKKLDDARQAPIVHDLNPISIIYEDLANNPTVKLASASNPGRIQALKNISEEFKNKTLSAFDTEDLIQRLNAQNETFYELAGGAKRSAVKENPILEANIKALEALRGVQNKALDASGYGNLKNQYGAWADVGDHALTQAVKQQKLEGRINLSEQLGIFGAIQNFGSLQGVSSYVAGKAVKYANSPDARFQTAYRRLADVPPRQNVPVVNQPSSPVPAPAAPTVAPTSLNQLIANLIAQYPPNIQANPSLAQSLARQQLGIGRGPAPINTMRPPAAPTP